MGTNVSEVREEVKVISLEEFRNNVHKATKGVVNLQDRVERLKTSINRINRLIEELRHEESNKR